MYTKVALATLLATTALASPAKKAAFEMPTSPTIPAGSTLRSGGSLSLQEAKDECTHEFDNGELWTVEDLQRTWDKDNTEARWQFKIKTDKDSYQCDYTIKAADGEKASETSNLYDPVDCEVFTVTQGYDPEGFTVLVPRYNPDGRQIYASYTNKAFDKEGKTDDESWCVEVHP